jgi:hypothetical protein
VRKARLELMIAHLVIAGNTLPANTTGADEWNCDPFPDLPSRYALTDLGNDARKLVSRHMRQNNIWVMTHPTVPIAAA